MKKIKTTLLAGFAVSLIFIGAGCNPFAQETEPEQSETITEDTNTETIDYGDAQMAEDTALSNPATVYCLSQEGQFYMKKTMNGMTEGYCVLPNGMECEVWAMYKGECGKVKKPESETNTTSTGSETDFSDTASTTTLSKPFSTSTTKINDTNASAPAVSSNGKIKIEGEIDIAVRPGDESREVVMTWDTHDFSAPEGYIVMFGTNSKLSHPAKFSHVIANESSYSFTWTDLNPEREYFFRVCIKKGDSCSTYSPVISITLSEP